MKRHNAITLLELLIAMSLLVLVIIAGSGICVSGLRMSRDTLSRAQSLRNAMAAMMHMAKNLQQCASEYMVMAGNTTMQFRRYGTPPDFGALPNIRSQYSFDNFLNQIVYNPDVTVVGDEQIIGSHIQNCTFSEFHTATHGTIIEINLTAWDNNNQNPYNIISRVNARYTAVEPVYTL